MGKRFPVVALDHADGETVYCWGYEEGVDAIRSCLNMHPEEAISIRKIKMTEKQYDDLPDYEGDC